MYVNLFALIYCNLFKNLQQSSCKGSLFPTIILTGGNSFNSYLYLYWYSNFKTTKYTSSLALIGEMKGSVAGSTFKNSGTYDSRQIFKKVWGMILSSKDSKKEGVNDLIFKFSAFMYKYYNTLFNIAYLDKPSVIHLVLSLHFLCILKSVLQKNNKKIKKN